MFRVLGFLVGSATSIAVILLVTGIPEFHLEDPAIDQQRFDEAVEKLMERKEQAEQQSADTPPDFLDVADTESVVPTHEEPDRTEQSAPQYSNVINSRELAAALPAIADLEPIPEDNFPEATDAQWYSFWSPFRSEIAANGFVSQLEKVTGLDYRVVKIKTGVFEVAFAYYDDTERVAKLSSISAATGLDLPD